MKKVYQYESFGDTLEFAESLGWSDTYGDAVAGNWRPSDADACEADAIEYIIAQGYHIIGY